MAVATDREYALFIGGERAEPASGEIRELTEKSVIASTGAEPINPFAL